MDIKMDYEFKAGFLNQGTNDYFEWDNSSLWDAVLCIVGCSAPRMASTYYDGKNAHLSKL